VIPTPTQTNRLIDLLVEGIVREQKKPRETGQEPRGADFVEGNTDGDNTPTQTAPP
jgi:hypothetical protein